MLYFRGKNKPLAANATNCKTIARMYGNDTNAWAGKAVTLYVATTSKDGEEMECIRIRPSVPAQKKEEA